MKKAWIAPEIDNVELTATEFGGDNKEDPDFVYQDDCEPQYLYDPSES